MKSCGRAQVHGFQKVENKKERRKYKQCRVNGKNMSQHRYLMQKNLGRELKSHEHVHHINNDPLDNRLENLILIPISEHSKITCRDHDNFKRK